MTNVSRREFLAAACLVTGPTSLGLRAPGQVDHRFRGKPNAHAGGKPNTTLTRSGSRSGRPMSDSTGCSGAEMLADGFGVGRRLEVASRAGSPVNKFVSGRPRRRVRAEPRPHGDVDVLRQPERATRRRPREMRAPPASAARRSSVLAAPPHRSRAEGGAAPIRTDRRAGDRARRPSRPAAHSAVR